MVAGISKKPAGTIRFGALKKLQKRPANAGPSSQYDACTACNELIRSYLAGRHSGRMLCPVHYQAAVDRRPPNQDASASAELPATQVAAPTTPAESIWSDTGTSSGSAASPESASCTRGFTDLSAETLGLDGVPLCGRIEAEGSDKGLSTTISESS